MVGLLRGKFGLLRGMLGYSGEFVLLTQGFSWHSLLGTLISKIIDAI